MNELMLNSLINRYNAVAFTHEYIFGFTDRHNVYVSFARADLLPYVCTLDRVASNRKGGFSLRFKPNKNQKELLKMQERTFVLCSENYFETMVSESKYNRGEIFEKLVTEYFKQEWVKDNVPFTKAGDLTVEGVAYQIKYQKATFCNEDSMANLERGEG